MLPRISDVGAVVDDRRQPVQQLGGSWIRISHLGGGIRWGRGRRRSTSRRPACSTVSKAQARAERAELDPVAARAGLHRRADPGRVRARCCWPARSHRSATTVRMCPPARPARRRVSTSTLLQRIQRAHGAAHGRRSRRGQSYLRADAEAAAFAQKSSSSWASNPSRSCRSPGCSPRACHAPQK